MRATTRIPDRAAAPNRRRRQVPNISQSLASSGPASESFDLALRQARGEFVQVDHQGRGVRIGDPFGRHVARQALEEPGDAGDFLLGAIEILQIVEMRSPGRSGVEDEPADGVVDPLQSARDFAQLVGHPAQRFADGGKRGAIGLAHGRILTYAAQGFTLQRSKQFDVADVADQQRLERLLVDAAGAT